MSVLQKILYIDDDPVVRRIYSAALTKAGFYTKSCEGLDNAERAYRLFKPDLVLLDVFMGGTTGPEICEKLCTTDIGKDCSFVYLSGGDARDVRWINSNADILGYIQKPYKSENLIEQVKMLWDQRDLLSSAIK